MRPRLHGKYKSARAHVNYVRRDSLNFHLLSEETRLQMLNVVTVNLEIGQPPPINPSRTLDIDIYYPRICIKQS